MQTFIDELKDYKRTTHADKLVITFWICMAERLLEKEKQQIIDAATWGFNTSSGDKYYNETFNK